MLGLADRLGKLPAEIGTLTIEEAAEMAAFYRLQDKANKEALEKRK